MRLDKMLDNDSDTEDNVVINAYDKLKKYELAERQLNLNTNDTSSDDTPTFTFDGCTDDKDADTEGGL